MQLNQSSKTVAPQSHLVGPISVRSQVATATRQAHEKLHVHPVISRLVTPNIGANAYRAILMSYLSFYQAAEATRKKYGLSPALSFNLDIENILQDLRLDRAPQSLLLPISSSLQALGMLYVLYGARFGALAIYRNLKTALPTQEHMFFRQGPDKLAWHVVLDLMEEHQGQDSDICDVVLGSQKTFAACDAWMRLEDVSKC